MVDNNSPLEKYPTNTKWILWYHNPSDKNWNLDSYYKLMEINSINDFCILRNSWKDNLPHVTEGMFFFMRVKNEKIIYPRWEDRHNREGGYWSLKIEKELSEEMWFNLLMLAIGETITNDNYNSENINGISISPKKHFCILKIWNNDSTMNSYNLLNTEFFENYKEIFLYSNHQNNISKDTQKKKFKRNY